MFKRRKGREAAEAEAAQPGQEDPGSSRDGSVAAALVTNQDVDVLPDGPAKPARTNGPWDAEEASALATDHPARAGSRVDLGGLELPAVEGLQVQMNVDERRGDAGSVLVAVKGAAMELLAVAAPRSRPLWPETLVTIQAELQQRNAAVTETKGPWGPLLQVKLPVAASDGRSGVQPSVVMGIDGPRWLLRVTLLGRAATEKAGRDEMLAILRRTVVARGEGPMAPGELIRLRPPPGVAPVPTKEDDQEADLEAADQPADEVPPISPAEGGAEPRP